MYSEKWKQDVNTDLFWSVIESARTNHEDFLKKIKDFDRKTLIWITWYFEELASRLGEEKYMIYADPGFSEDSLDDLWEEVVGKGKAFYETVLENPEKLPASIDYSDSSHTIRYSVSNVFFERYGNEIPPNSYDY